MGVIFGIIALFQINRTGQPGRGMAIAGIAIGTVVTVGWVIFILLAGFFGAHDANKHNHRYHRYDSSAPMPVPIDVATQPLGLVNSG
ncbi:hypothetical protein BST27_18945 [Mycobacterium intermedium]|uniref:DUF4190 domain-containing protein n=1 Tax=Mycobacterium intermedium TaxID=28445 RepID=A0A1E3SEK7_MYCIE|nr:DUF4190 domain-containing protein [Mycobacterium intermedium]ODR00083.1 hypothetical protein BHQ20_14280 [Mycobacterium intermedium]OPE47182.1 hypothetical protein BV508_23040 [Mycobacterium intermedium]ORA99883.1 hypothetical protein BST27_18945 [Mycobacterium intermedium]